jgi:4'-phosphopantetheinyl transferase
MHSGADVELWCARPTDGETPEMIERCRALLTDDEREAENRFRMDDVRRRWRWTRAMVRCVLSHYGNVPPHAWRFRRTALGKPELIGPAGALPHGNVGPLRFNLAHSGRMIVCAVTDAGQIGVDVEQIRARRRMRELARRFFAPDELAWLDGQPAARRPEAFFRLWTLKEAYLKARGTGLSMSLSGFAVSPGAEGPPGIAFSDRCPDDPARWCLAEWGDAGDAGDAGDGADREAYRLAVAIESTLARRPPRLRWREVTPLGDVLDERPI